MFSAVSVRLSVHGVGEGSHLTGLRPRRYRDPPSPPPKLVHYEANA